VFHAGYIAQLSLVDYTEARVAPGSCTVLYKQMMTCTQSVQKIRICLLSSVHAPGSDQMYSGVQQLPMHTQNILNCSDCPKTKICETKCKQRIDNHNCQAQGGKNDQKLCI
jgi:hypothetical protein